MKMHKGMKDLVFVINGAEDFSIAGYSYYKMTAHLARWNSLLDKPVYDLHSLELEAFTNGFQVRAQADCDRGKEISEQLYGWHCEYHDIHAVELDQINRMQFILQTIERGVKKIADERGRARSFGQFVGHVSAVLGVKSIVVNRNASTLRDNRSEQYRVCTIGDGIDQIDYEYAKWRKNKIDQNAA